MSDAAALDAEPDAPRSAPNWPDLIGHDRVVGWLTNAIANGRLGGSFLLVGAPGIGKRTLARLLARTLLCQRREAALMNPCGTCPGCLQVIAGTHPDLLVVGKPPDKSVIPLDLLIGPPEARMQTGFCHEIRLRPMCGGRKVAILQDADDLNEEGANCLLKTLEEPPSGAVILLIGTSEQQQLPTIRSRCQVVRLGPLDRGSVTALLRSAYQIDADDTAIAEAIETSGGDVRAAARLLTEQDGEFRDALTAALSSTNPDPVALARLINRRVESAGKEASRRRAALRDLFSVCIQHFRRQLRRQAERNDVAAATLARLDRSVRAIREVDRNANQSTLIECFAADLALAVTGDRGDLG